MEREHWGCNHVSQRINEQIGTLSAIESERHFFAVGLQMLRANFMPRPNNAALQERESRLDCVGVDVTLHVDSQAVPNRLVPSVFPKMLCGAPVGVEIVGVQNLDIFANILADVFFERATFYVCGMKESQIAAALTDADYVFLVIPPCVFSLAAIHAADECLVHFYFAVEHRPTCLDHRGADSVTEIPRRLVADSECSLNLASGHSLFRFAEQIRCSKPLLKRKMGVVEDRSGRYGELIAA